jgi:hypothetical protein
VLGRTHGKISCNSFVKHAVILSRDGKSVNIDLHSERKLN